MKKHLSERGNKKLYLESIYNRNWLHLLWNWCWRCKYSWRKLIISKRERSSNIQNFWFCYQWYLSESTRGNSRALLSDQRCCFQFGQCWLFLTPTVVDRRELGTNLSQTLILESGQVELWRCWSKLKWVRQTKFLAS